MVFYGIFRRAVALTLCGMAMGSMRDARKLDDGRPRRAVAMGHRPRGDGGGRRLAACLVAVAAVLSGISSGASPGGSSSAAATSRRPVTQPAVVRVTAQDVREMIRGAAGRVVLVNVWATWCEPCRQEFPDLLRLRRALAAKGLDLILVSADFDKEFPQVRSFLARKGVDFTTYFKNESDTPFINGMDPAWSGSLPATFVYDRSGTLRDFWEGLATYDKLFAKVSTLLGSSPTTPLKGE